MEAVPALARAARREVDPVAAIASQVMRGGSNHYTTHRLGYCLHLLGIFGSSPASVFNPLINYPSGAVKRRLIAGLFGPLPRRDPDPENPVLLMRRDSDAREDAAKGSDPLIWFLRTELTGLPRTVELLQYAKRKADGFRRTHAKDATEHEWHIRFASAIHALEGGHTDQSFERLLRRQGKAGIAMMNALMTGNIVPPANWWERLWTRAGYEQWATLRRVARAELVMPAKL